MAQTGHKSAEIGHKSAEMVRRYIRDGELFRDNAADLGL